MKNRTLQREDIIKILYLIYLYDKTKISYVLDDLINENTDNASDFIILSVNEVIKYEKEIKELANKYLKDWTIDRLSLVDKAILSLGIYELIYTDTPDIVCINEAIELAKQYSDYKVIDMINATMDNIYHNEVKDE